MGESLTMGDFASKVGAWAAKTPQRLTATYRRSVELLADEMTKTVGNGGKLPHKTGNLMRSLLASAAGPPPQGAEDQKYHGSNVAVIASVIELGDSVWLGYQARYAHRMNYGFSGPDSLGRVYSQAGFGFVEDAISKWPALVRQAANELQTAVESR